MTAKIEIYIRSIMIQLNNYICIMNKRLLLFSCINMALCIALGAFGAHLLKNYLDRDQLTVFDTGLKYHIYHSLALLFLSYSAGVVTRMNTILFILGMIFFSGSLYVITLCKITALEVPFLVGIATPIGGILLILAWIILARNVYKTQ